METMSWMIKRFGIANIRHFSRSSKITEDWLSKMGLIEDLLANHMALGVLNLKIFVVKFYSLTLGILSV